MTMPQIGSNAGGQAEGADSRPLAGSAMIPQLSSARLLRAAGEAVIEHEGQFYHLRRTGRGGLVLTK